MMCRAVIRVASNKKEASLLRGLLSRALWTLTCPFCGSTHEYKAHVLWDCLQWYGARDTWTQGGP